MTSSTAVAAAPAHKGVPRTIRRRLEAGGGGGGGGGGGRAKAAAREADTTKAASAAAAAAAAAATARRRDGGRVASGPWGMSFTLDPHAVPGVEAAAADKYRSIR